MGKHGNNGNLGIIIISINFSIVCSQDMFWYWERDFCKAKVFEENNTRASSNPLEAYVPEFVRVLRLDLASEQGETGEKSHSTLMIFCAEFSSYS